MNLQRFRRPVVVASLAFILTAGTSLAVDTDSPPPPPAPKGDGKGKQDTKSGKEKQKNSDREFLDGYRYAHALIQNGDYLAGIAAMRALGHDDHPDVANYIGYAYRKRGLYQESQIWYERALAADPRHVRTWSYYGMWHAELGSYAIAEEYLEKIRLICGNEDCKEFRDLRKVIEEGGTY